MQNVFIIGSSGKIGFRLVKLLESLEHHVTGMCRTVEQRTALMHVGADVVMADLIATSVEQLAVMMKGSDTVIFTAGAAGAGIELTNKVDGQGAENAVDAAKLAGVSRFILISAFPEAGRTRDTTASFENYLAVKKQSEAYLTNSDLDWLIVRPGRLTDDIGKGKINAGPALIYDTVTRDDVAASISTLINMPDIKHKIIELTKGEHAIEDALSLIK